MKTNVIVEKTDLCKLGHTMYEENGNLVILCNFTLANITEILLRSVLTCFGNEYKIVSSNDFYQEGDEEFNPSSVQFKTNLPFKTYIESR